MKKSEKLLDAIGQIDDRLVEEAAREEAVPGRKRKKRTVLLRWQGALAACALLAVCIGMFRTLERMGALQPFTGDCGGKQAEEIAMDACGSPQERAEACAQEETPPAAGEYALADSPAEPAAAAETLEGTRQAAAESSKEEFENNGPNGAGQEEGSQDDLQEKKGALQDRPALLTERKKAGGKQDGSQAEQGVVGQEICLYPEAETVPVTAAVLECSAQSLRYVFTNQGEKTVLLREEYGLERMSEDRWETVSPQAKESRELSEVSLLTGESREETIFFTDRYGTLTAGTYRIAISYRMENPQQEESGIYNTYLEFTVSP